MLEETLGTSDGTPNQRFPLAHAGLILRSLGQGQAIQRDIVLLTDWGESWRSGLGRKIWRSIVRDRKILWWRSTRTTAPA